MTITVTMADIRSARMCSGGTRDFFRRHGMDWNKFLSEGLPEQDFIQTGDAMAMQVVKKARERHG